MYTGVRLGRVIVASLHGTTDQAHIVGLTRGYQRKIVGANCVIVCKVRYVGSGPARQTRRWGLMANITYPLVLHHNDNDVIEIRPCGRLNRSDGLGRRRLRSNVSENVGGLGRLRSDNSAKGE